MRIGPSIAYILRYFMRICILFLCMHASGRTQSRISKEYIDDSVEISRVYDIAMKQANPDSAIPLFKITLQRATAIHCEYIIQGSLLMMGEKYGNKGDWEQAIAYIKRSRPYCYSAYELGNYYCHLGWVYFTMGDYVGSSENFYMALGYLKKEAEGGPNEAASYRFLGMINTRLHQNEKAANYFNLSEAAARRYPNARNYLALTLISKGEFYNILHRPDSAQKCYSEALDIADEIGRKDLNAEANAGMGKAFIESGAYQKAVHHLQLALSVAEIVDRDLAIDISFNLGEALFRLRRYREAEVVLLPALKLSAAKKRKDNAIAGYTTLMEVYKALGLYATALGCMDSITVLKDALVSAENVKAINIMDIKYKTAEKDKKIALQDSKIARKNMWILSIASCIIILLLASAWIHVHALNKQKSLEKENKIGILNAAILGGDNERGRIARELHDGIGGMLSAAMMRFSAMPRDNAAITATPAYNDAMSILREMGDEIRKTAHNLMPEVLLKQSLPDAVRAYCNSVRKPGVLEMDFQYYGSFCDLSEYYKLNLYRVVQELVKNVVEHAGATAAIVQLMRTDDTLILSVEDNGAGFDAEESKGGQGLHNTQTRIKSLDGKFTLGSVPGKGTSVFIEIKIPPNQPIG